MRAESDACFGLAEGVDDSIVAQVGVDSHHGEVVLEGGVSSNQPLSSGLCDHGNWEKRKRGLFKSFSGESNGFSMVQEIINTPVVH